MPQDKKVYIDSNQIVNNVRILVSTFNMGNNKPDKLETIVPLNGENIDIAVLGFQESLPHLEYSPWLSRSYYCSFWFMVSAPRLADFFATKLFLVMLSAAIIITELGSMIPLVWRKWNTTLAAFPNHSRIFTTWRFTPAHTSLSFPSTRLEPHFSQLQASGHI